MFWTREIRFFIARNHIGLLFLLFFNLLLIGRCDYANNIESDKPITSVTPHEYAGYWESANPLNDNEIELTKKIIE